MLNLHHPTVRIDFYLRRGESSSRWVERDRYALCARFHLDKYAEIGDGDYKVSDRKLNEFKTRLLDLENANACQREAEIALLQADEAFDELPLRTQCSVLGVQLVELRLQRESRDWVVNGATYRKPEEAVRAYYRLDGYDGTICEGLGPITLVRCGCLEVLKKNIKRVAQFRIGKTMARHFACTAVFARLCDEYDEDFTELLGNIIYMTDDRMLNNIREVLSEGGSQAGKFCEQELWALWRAFGSSGLSMIANAFFQTRCFYDSGWPDLTLAKGSEVKFIEVKTSDSLHNSQRETLRELLLPLNVDLSIVKLTKAK